MKSIKIYASTLLLLIGIHSTYAMDNERNSLKHRVLGYIGQSRLVCAAEKKLAALERAVTNSPFNDTSIVSPADKAYQDLFTEAQNNVGIRPERHVPLFEKSASPHSPGAETIAQGVYLNTRHFPYYCLGTQRALMHHEAIHIKYNDPAMGFIVPITAITTSTIGTKICLNKTVKALAARTIPSFSNWPKKYRWPLLTIYSLGSSALSLKAGLLCGASTNEAFHRFGERRADVEGFYTTACYQCADALTEDQGRVDPKYLEQRGYLTRTELQSIADQLRAEHKLCEHHKKSL